MQIFSLKITLVSKLLLVAFNDKKKLTFMLLNEFFFLEKFNEKQFLVIKLDVKVAWSNGSKMLYSHSPRFFLLFGVATKKVCYATS